MLITVPVQVGNPRHCNSDCNTDARQYGVNADTLLNVVYAIQDTISSPQVQMLHEVRQVQSDDLSLFYDSMYVQLINTNITTEYATLYSRIESCVMACNNYHEEIFLLESELQELLELIHESELTDDSLDKIIHYESELLQDMQTRVDTNLEKIAIHIEYFHELKPQIDSMIIQSGVEIQAP